MKLSLNWAHEVSNVDLVIDKKKLLEKIGSQLGAIEEVIELGPHYEGIVVAKVVSCEKHPDADKLSVCLIDDGGVTKKVNRDKKGLIQVVCGAPNVAKGQTVLWLPPGSSVPATFDDEPLVLEARKIRGQMSNGMIGSGAELAVNADHNGILVLDDDWKIGTPVTEVLNLNDTVIDIENKMFTHRPDCFGILGLARELAGIQQLKFSSPEWYLEPVNGYQITDNKKLPLEVRNEALELVPRFMAVAIEDVEIKPEPPELDGAEKFVLIAFTPPDKSDAKFVAVKAPQCPEYQSGGVV